MWFKFTKFTPIPKATVAKKTRTVILYDVIGSLSMEHSLFVRDYRLQVFYENTGQHTRFLYTIVRVALMLAVFSNETTRQWDNGGKIGVAPSYFPTLI